MYHSTLELVLNYHSCPAPERGAASFGELRQSGYIYERSFATCLLVGRGNLFNIDGDSRPSPRACGNNVAHRETGERRSKM